MYAINKMLPSFIDLVQTVLKCAFKHLAAKCWQVRRPSDTD